MLEREYEDEIVEVIEKKPERAMSIQSLARMPKAQREEYEATHDMERVRKLAPKKFTKEVKWRG